MDITKTLQAMDKEVRITSARDISEKLIQRYSGALNLLNKREQLAEVLRKIEYKQTITKTREEEKTLSKRFQRCSGLEEVIVDSYASNDIAIAGMIGELRQLQDFYDPDKNKNYYDLSNTERDFAEGEFLDTLDELKKVKEEHDKRFYEGLEYVREEDSSKKSEMFVRDMFEIIENKKRWEKLDQFRDRVQVAATKKVIEDSDEIRNALGQAEEEIEVVVEDYTPAQPTAVRQG